MTEYFSRTKITLSYVCIISGGGAHYFFNETILARLMKYKMRCYVCFLLIAEVSSIKDMSTPAFLDFYTSSIPTLTTETSEESYLDNNYSITAPLIIVLILVTCSSNLLLIMVILLTKTMNTITNMYVCSLAVTDFLVGSVAMSGLAGILLSGEMIYNKATFTAWISLETYLCQVSIYILLFISHDRYIAICKHTDYQTVHTRSKVKKNIMIGWILGFLVWIPSIVVERHVYQTGENIEGGFFPSAAYGFILSCVNYFIPICMIVCMYSVCIISLRKRLKKGKV